METIRGGNTVDFRITVDDEHDEIMYRLGILVAMESIKTLAS